MGLADRCTGAHEGVEYRHVCKVLGLIELLGEIVVLGQLGAKKDAAKHRSEALRPPFMDVVDRAMDFLPPALTLCELGKELERERIRFD